jgi:NAD+ synthetase
VKIRLAPLNPTVGDLDGNARLILDAAREALHTDLLVLPELCLCAYPPRDLLLADSFIAACAERIDRLARELPPHLAVAVGAPLPHPDRSGGVTNSLVVLHGGRAIARHDKRLLPTYDVFDEDRYFTPGHAPVIAEVAGERVGLTLCEDLWRGEDAGAAGRYAGAPDPVADLAHAGATVIINPSASPFVAGKHGRHRAIMAAHAARHGIPVLSINQLGGNDDLIFDGAADAVDRDGRLCRHTDRFSGLTLDIDTRALSPAAPQPADETDALARALILGVRDYARKCGFGSACLGLSGGVDSALTAVIAACAIGPSNLLGVAMPGPFSSDHALTDARDLAERLGCRFIVAPINAPFEGLRAGIDPLFRELDLPTLGAAMPDLTQENLQSRLRGTLMMAVSNRTGTLLLTTGNKSELAVGYSTLYGDMNGGLAVISDLVKGRVYELARRFNERHADFGLAVPPIPVSTIDKPPSAELAPGQLDQDTLPPYDVLDEIVRRHVEERQAADRIAAETGFDPGLVRRMTRLIAINEYKRKQLAIGLKVTPVAFGRGRRMPLAASTAAL